MYLTNTLEWLGFSLGVFSVDPVHYLSTNFIYVSMSKILHEYPKSKNSVLLSYIKNIDY